MQIPDQGMTPYEELENLEDWVAELPRPQVIVNFHGKRGKEHFGIDGLEDETLAPRFIRLTKLIIANEMGDWSDGKGGYGSLRFSGDMEPWLNAESTEQDYDYERTPDDYDLENLEWDMRDMPEWVSEESDTPAP